MKKSIKTEKIYIFIALLVTTIVLGANILKYNITSTDDGYLHLIKVIGVSEIIKIKQFPPIINPGFCNGYAINLFYNPLTTYISLIIGNIFNNYALGIKLMLFTMLILAMMFMYYFMKKVTNRKDISIVAAIFYVTGSYYLSNIYIRGAIGECAALSFLPLLFLGMYSLFSSDGKSHYFISIGAIGLLLTHNITTLFAFVICIVYVLININKLKDVKIVKKILINIVFIIGVTLFFIYPLGLHRISSDYVVFNSNLMRTTGENVSKNIIQLKELFLKTNNHEIIFKFNPVQLILFLLNIYCIKYVDKKYKKLYIFSIAFTIICSISAACTKLWLNMPDIFCIIQFPWRLLGFSGFFMSIVSAINLVILLEKVILKNQSKKFNIIFIVIPIAMLSLFLAYKNNDNINIEKNIDEKSITFINNNKNNIRYENINREYLPCKTYKTLYENPEDVYKSKITVLDGDISIGTEKKDNLRYEAIINYSKKNTKLEIPFLYYYGYNAYLEKANSSKTKIAINESKSGFLEIEIPKDIENAKLTVEYKTPISYYVVYIISFIMLICFIIYIVKYKSQI